MLLSPYGCRLGPRGYSLSRPQRVHFCYGPMTRGLPWGDLVDRLQSFSLHHLCYPNYGALTFTPAGLPPAEHASLRWTHNRTCGSPASGFPTDFISQLSAARHVHPAQPEHAQPSKPKTTWSENCRVPRVGTWWRRVRKPRTAS